MVLFLSGFSLSIRCRVCQQPPYFGHRAISPNGGARVVWNLEQFQCETWEWCRALLRHERDNLFVMSFNLASGVSILRVIYQKASANACWKNGETLEKTLGFCWKVGVAEMVIMKGLTTIFSPVLPNWRDFFDIPESFVEYAAENLR